MSHPIAESAAHRELKRAAAESWIDVNSLRELLWGLNAHDRLIGLAHIAENALEICRLIPTYWEQSLKAFGLDKWPKILEWLVSNRAELAGRVPGGLFDIRPSHEGHNPLLRRGILRYPLYTSLYNDAKGDLRERFRLLQAHLLVAHIHGVSTYSTVLDYENQSDEYVEWCPMPNKVYLASLAVRELSLESRADFLRQLPTEQSPEDFCISIQDTELPEGHDKILLERHRRLTSFLQRIWGEREWRERTMSSSTRSGASGIVRVPISGFIEINSEFVSTENLLGDPDDPGSDWGQQSVISARRHNRKEQRALLESDLDPDELDEDDELVLTGYADGSEATGLAGVLGAAAGQIKHIAMASQILPWSPQQLTLEEVAETLAFLDQLWHGITIKAAPTRDDELVLECIAMLDAILWTASPLERAHKLCVLNSGIAGIGIELGFRPCEEPFSCGQWLFPALSPPYQLDRAPVPVIERVRDVTMQLPDRAGAGNRILDLLRRRGVAVDPTVPMRVFGKTLEAYRRRISRLLAEHDISGRVTAVKLSHVLFDRLACKTQDVTKTMLMYGRIHALGRVRLFYSTSYTDKLQAEYVLEVDAVLDELKASGWTVGPNEPTQAPRTSSVGSRGCPSFDAVAKAVAMLRSEIAESAGDLSDAGLVRHHALYTLYSIWDLAFAVARRAVVTPYVKPGQIDIVTGLGTIREKDDGSGYRERLIWLPPEQVEQMCHFFDHMSLIRRRTGGPHLDEPAFLIDGGMIATPIRPKDQEALMADFLPFPANVQRRFMRMQLLDRGCAPEVVDGWMGHWGRGEEPWGEMSSLPFEQCVLELKSHLIPVLQALGFAPIKSALT